MVLFSERSSFFLEVTEEEWAVVQALVSPRGQTGGRGNRSESPSDEQTESRVGMFGSGQEEEEEESQGGGAPSFNQVIEKIALARPDVVILLRERAMARVEGLVPQLSWLSEQNLDANPKLFEDFFEPVAKLVDTLVAGLGHRIEGYQQSIVFLGKELTETLLFGAFARQGAGRKVVEDAAALLNRLRELHMSALAQLAAQEREMAPSTPDEAALQ